MAQLIYGTTDRTQGVLNYTVSESATQVTISASSDLQAKSYYQSGYQITTSVGSKSTSAEDYIRYLYGSFNTAFSTGAVSETYTKNYSPYTVTVSSSYTGKNVSGYLAGSKSGSTSVTITIPAKASYAVSYNANGGSGAPSAQTKWYDETLVLSSTIPTRTGYSFVGWGTSSGDTSVDYPSGGSYTTNAPITLYAIWSANTYTVSYNANGGSGAPGNQTKTYGVTLTLSSTRPTRAYYNFLGWSTSSSATTAQYSAGGAFTTNANTTLYAVWQLAYTKPSITNVNIYRANSSGTASDEGTYITYNFSWSIFSSVSLQNIQLQYKLTTASSWTTGATLTPSGTSGTVNTTVGGGLIDITKTYDVRIVVTDTRDYSQYYTIVATSSAIIDVDTQNNGVAIGKYSEKANTLEIALDVEFENPEQVKDALGINLADGNLVLKPASGEGGQILLEASSADTKNNGIAIDTANGDFRIFGLESADGTSRTGYGSVLEIDPYDKTIKGGYTFDGKSANVTGTVAITNGGTDATTKAGARKNLGFDFSNIDSLWINSNPVNGWLLQFQAPNSVDNHTYRIGFDKWGGVYGIDDTAGTYIWNIRPYGFKKASVTFSNSIGTMSASGVTTSSTVLAIRGDSNVTGSYYSIGAADCNSAGTIKLAQANGSSQNATWTVSAWWSL